MKSFIFVVQFNVITSRLYVTFVLALDFELRKRRKICSLQNWICCKGSPTLISFVLLKNEWPITLRFSISSSNERSVPWVHLIQRSHFLINLWKKPPTL